MKPKEFPPRKLPFLRGRANCTGVWLALGLLGAAVAFISCGTVTRTVLAPPAAVPDAKFIGSSACADCHEEIVKEFKTASHARLMAKGANAKEMGCESCHGPGSVHNEAGGGRSNIVNPRKSAEACMECHLDKRGEFALSYHHPVLEGKMTCTSCHDPHKGPAVRGGGTAIASMNETCFECHGAQRGPHAFEHEAMREGCLTCHQPHGSVNAKMLTIRNANLCLRCHFQQQAGAGQLLIGGRDHTMFVRQGTCWSGGCHEAVHGSQVNSSLRF